MDLLADTTVVLEVLLLGSEATAKATKIGRIAFEKCIVKAVFFLAVRVRYRISGMVVC